jgi:hypothetical protein
VELEVMSNWMLTTAGALQVLGYKVPQEDLKKAVHFVEECCNEGQGAVGYSPNQGQKGFGDPCRTGGAIAAFAILNLQQTKVFPRMVEYWKASIGESNEGHGSLGLGFLASALAARQVGQDERNDFGERFFGQILSARRLDGSFRALIGKSPKALAGADEQMGPAYNTAIYLDILLMSQNDGVFFGHCFEAKRKE